MLASDAGSLPASLLSSGIVGMSLESVSLYIKDGTEMEKWTRKGLEIQSVVSGAACPFPQRLTRAEGPEQDTSFEKDLQSYYMRRVLVAFTRGSC